MIPSPSFSPKKHTLLIQNIAAESSRSDTEQWKWLTGVAKGAKSRYVPNLYGAENDGTRSHVLVALTSA